MAFLNKPFCSLSAQPSTPSVATAAASSCAGSPVPTSQSNTESVASPTAALKRDLEGVEAQLRGLADRRARVEAELLRITCEETFLRRQQRCLLHGTFAAEYGEDADSVDRSPRVEVASGPAPPGLHVSRSHHLVSGWIDKLNCFFILGVTPCAPDFFPGAHQVRAACREGAGARNARPGSACSSCPRLPWVTDVACHTSGGVDEGERGRSEGVGRVGGAVL